MSRTFAAIACLVLASGFAFAGERLLTHEAAHKDDRDKDSVIAMLRLQRQLAEIIEKQQAVAQGIRVIPPPPCPHAGSPEPVLGAAPPLRLAKGETATVQHKIEWRQYPDDELEVKLFASDDLLVLPEKLVLEYEKHQFRFEYHVKAGDKTGEFTVTLTPKVGKPVVVNVIVK